MAFSLECGWDSMLRMLCKISLLDRLLLLLHLRKSRNLEQGDGIWETVSHDMLICVTMCVRTATDTDMPEHLPPTPPSPMSTDVKRSASEEELPGHPHAEMSQPVSIARTMTAAAHAGSFCRSGSAASEMFLNLQPPEASAATIDKREAHQKASLPQAPMGAPGPMGPTEPKCRSVRRAWSCCAGATAPRLKHANNCSSASARRRARDIASGKQVARHSGKQVARHSGKQVAGHSAKQVAGRIAKQVARHIGKQVAGHSAKQVAGHNRISRGHRRCSHRTRVWGGPRSMYEGDLRHPSSGVPVLWEVCGEEPRVPRARAGVGSRR